MTFIYVKTQGNKKKRPKRIKKKKKTEEKKKGRKISDLRGFSLKREKICVWFCFWGAIYRVEQEKRIVRKSPEIDVAAERAVVGWWC